MKYIICNEGGGLCNRITPILSLLSLIETFNSQKNREKYKLIFIWRITPPCSIRYLQLFNSNNILFVENYDEAYKQIEINKIDNIINFNNLNNKPPIEDMINCKNSIDLDNYLEYYSNIFIRINPFLPSKYVNYNIFPKLFSNLLIKELKDEILFYKKKLNLNRNVIGCHIRRTDRKCNVSIKKEENIFKLIEKNKTQLYFVASDENIIEKCAKYKNIIIQSNIKYPLLIKNKINRTEDDIIPAIKDLCFLSFCNIDNNDYHTHAGNHRILERLKNVNIPHLTISSFINIAKLIRGWDRY